MGGDPKGRGVVAAASYEARKFGVRSAIPMARAVRLCPDLVIVKPDFRKYSAVSKEIFALYRAVTPLVEPLSLDEAYLDVTENAWGEPLGMQVARRLKAQVKEATGLTVSAGVAPNKFLAKIASGWKKPDGLTVIAPERMEAFLAKLPVEALWGVGPKTAERLRAIGCPKLVDVRDGRRGGAAARRRELGGVARPPRARRRRPSRRARQDPEVRQHGGHVPRGPRGRRARCGRSSSRMARHDAAFLAEKRLLARTVTLKVRYADFTTVTRSDSARPTRDADELAARAAALLARTEAGARPVRLLGVGVHGLVSPGAPGPDGQLPLWED